MKKLFSKSLTSTDVQKRLAIPSKTLTYLLPNGNGTLELIVRRGTVVWPITCTTRRKGYKKPVFSKGWKQFVVENNLNVGDFVTLYKDEEGESGRPCCQFKIEVKGANSAAAGDHSGEASCDGIYSCATTCKEVCAAGDVSNVSAGGHFGEASCNGTYSGTTICGTRVAAGNYSGEATSKANCMIEDGGTEQSSVHEDEEVENFVPFKLFGVLVAGILPPVVNPDIVGAGISENNEDGGEPDGINLDLTLTIG